MTFINTISQDGRITTQELLAFFAEKGTIDDAARNARYWLEKIDGYGDTSGCITKDEMLNYFNSLSAEEALDALATMEAQEGYADEREQKGKRLEAQNAEMKAKMEELQKERVRLEAENAEMKAEKATEESAKAAVAVKAAEEAAAKAAEEDAVKAAEDQLARINTEFAQAEKNSEDILKEQKRHKRLRMQRRLSARKKKRQNQTVVQVMVTDSANIIESGS